MAKKGPNAKKNNKRGGKKPAGKGKPENKAPKLEEKPVASIEDEVQSDSDDSDVSNGKTENQAPKLEKKPVASIDDEVQSDSDEADVENIKALLAQQEADLDSSSDEESKEKTKNTAVKPVKQLRGNEYHLHVSLAI